MAYSQSYATVVVRNPSNVNDAMPLVSADGLTVDLYGQQDWFSKYFSNRRPLRYKSFSWPFTQTGVASGRGRVANLIAPVKEFPYQIELESSVIRATGSGDTSGGSFSLGGTEKGSVIVVSGLAACT